MLVLLAECGTDFSYGDSPALTAKGDGLAAALFQPFKKSFHSGLDYNP